jgi:triacylglycerol esterase/lipase EstA (alpha/beta hydrolase family)
MLFPQFGTGSESMGLVYLVPGTLNSTMPGCHVTKTPYYACEIIAAIQDLGFDTHVVKNLKPTGSIFDNGEILAKKVRKHLAANPSLRSLPVFFLGHSAGGLYSLHASSLLKDLDIRSILTVSTPLQGSRVADFFFENKVFGKALKRFAEMSQFIWDLRGLKQVTTKAATELVTQLVLPRGLRVYSAFATQKPSTVGHFMDAKYLAPLLSFTCGIFDVEKRWAR